MTTRGGALHHQSPLFHRLQGAVEVGFVDDEGDGELLAALGGGDDVDAGGAERGVDVAGGAGDVLHAAAEEGNDADALVQHHDIVEGQQGPAGDEILHGGDDAGAVLAADGEADAVLGRGLGDEADIDALGGQRGEDAAGEADLPEKAGAEHGHKVEIPLGDNAGNRGCGRVKARKRGNFGDDDLRRGDVLDENRDARLLGRPDGRGRERGIGDGTVVGGLVVGDGTGPAERGGAEEFDGPGTDGGGDQGRHHVGAAPADADDPAAGLTGITAGNDHAAMAGLGDGDAGSVPVKIGLRGIRTADDKLRAVDYRQGGRGGDGLGAKARRTGEYVVLDGLEVGLDGHALGEVGLEGAELTGDLFLVGGIGGQGAEVGLQRLEGVADGLFRADGAVDQLPEHVLEGLFGPDDGDGFGITKRGVVRNAFLYKRKRLDGNHGFSVKTSANIVIIFDTCRKNPYICSPKPSQRVLMFENLSERLERSFKILKGEGKITEINVAETVKDIRKALLDADVSFKVAKEFCNTVKDKALGQNVLTAVKPQQMMVKIVRDEMAAFMGSAASEVNLKGNPAVVLVAGLNGSGKTTFSGKLALHVKSKKGMKVMLAACDTFRPAAIEQLKVLGETVGVPVYSEDGVKDPIQIARNAIKKAGQEGYSVVIVDTAGRLAVDDELMDEISALHQAVKPTETLFVVDAMTGQDAVETARIFNERLDFDGVVLTKMDGDTRGGAALSIKAVVGKPIKFVSTGEKMEALDIFHPDRIADRILGMGDVVTLVEKAQEQFDEKQARELKKKLAKDKFSLWDFYEQIQQVKKMGNIKDLAAMIPGVGKAIKDVDIPDDAFKSVEAIILSMTPYEREHPDVLNGSRRKRIADGSGTSLQEVNKLLKQFEGTRKVMKGAMTGNLMQQMRGMRR